MSDQESDFDPPGQTPLEAIAREMGDPALFPAEVHRLYDAGKVRQARRRLLKHARTERSVQRAARQREAASELRYWLSPVSGAPGMFSLNGIGTRLIGRKQEREDGTYVGTLWFTIVFLPVWAISSFLVLPAEKGWHFLARAPLPGGHARTRWLSGAVLGALAMWGSSVAYSAQTHTDLFVYNGFDRPLFARINGAQKEVQPWSHALFEDLALAPTDLEASWKSAADPFEHLQVDLSGRGRATVVYNVAGRGLIAIQYVQYGEGIPREGRWLDPGPVLSVDEPLDYRFSEPPESISVSRSSSGSEKSWLYGIDDGGRPEAVVAALIADGRRDQALTMARAELEIAPSNAVLASVTAAGVFPDDVQARLEFLRGYLGRAPEAVDLHRAYQEHWPEEDRDELRAEYDALLASHESSAMYHYLAGRIRETGSAAELRHYRAALALDPDYGPAFRGLAYRATVAENWSEALTQYGRFAALGPAEALEALDSQLRVARRAGQDAESGLRLVEEVLDQNREALMIAHLAAQYAVEVDPAAVDEAARGNLEAVRRLVELEDPAAFKNNVTADLAITAGDLETARDRLSAVVDLASRNPDVALRLALSSGATDSDRRLLVEIPDWFNQLSRHFRPIALVLDDSDMLPLAVASPEEALQEIGRLFQDEEQLIDPVSFNRVVDPGDLQWRAMASWAAARRLEEVAGVAAERARRRYLRTADGFALPGELPYTGR